MRAIAKSAKIHPAAKKCCGWEEPAIYKTRLVIIPEAPSMAKDSYEIFPSNFDTIPLKILDLEYEINIGSLINKSPVAFQQFYQILSVQQESLRGRSRS